MLRVQADYHTSENMIIEILLRLPVKSLMRFRCVCKTWKTLVRNTNFISKQLNYHNSDARLLIQHCNYYTKEFAFALFLDETLTEEPLLSRDLEVQHMRCALGVIGPFNGILGLWNWNDIALWNPAIREFRFLSEPDTNLPPYFSPYFYSFGFGFDLTTNDYKVVWIRYFWDDKNDISYDPRVVSVYTLGTDSWRVFEFDLSEIGVSPIQDPLCNTYMNGFYYWLIIYGDYYDFCILSFDMGNEVFRMIKVLQDMPTSKLGALSMYNHSIAIFVYDQYEVEKHFDIWLMKEENCWTKQLTIGPILDVQGPLGFWKNGEVFLERATAESAVLYNPNTGETRDFRTRGKDECLRVFIYKESLVSVYERK